MGAVFEEFEESKPRFVRVVPTILVERWFSCSSWLWSVRSSFRWDIVNR